jgi:hypothetical protein
VRRPDVGKSRRRLSKPLSEGGAAARLRPRRATPSVWAHQVAGKRGAGFEKERRRLKESARVWNGLCGYYER